MIRLDLKVPENFLSLIFLDRFWFVHTPFVSMVKFELLAQFPVGHLSHPVVPSLVFFLYIIIIIIIII